MLYDPRKLATPWDQTSCSGNEVIKDLHWQHTITSKSSRTAVKGCTRDSQSLRSSNDQAGIPPHASAPSDHAAVLATPAPTSHVRPWPLHKTWRQCQCDFLCFHVLAVIDHPSQGGSFTVCLHAWKDGAITLCLHSPTLCDSGSASWLHFLQQAPYLALESSCAIIPGL